MNRILTYAAALTAVTILNTFGCAAVEPVHSKFEIAGRPAFAITPGNHKKQTPWIMYAPALGNNIPGGAEKWMFDQFLAKGIAIAGVDVGESYGSPKGRETYTALYNHLIERGFAKRACLLARSRGGLMLYNWAAENPEKVCGIAGIYPVCNLASYPGLQKACKAYDMTEEELKAKLKEHNPVDRLWTLARACVPVYHIHGDSDKVVPLKDNSGLVAERYKKMRGKMTLNVVKGQGHNMYQGFFQCQGLVDFVIESATWDSDQNYGSITETTPSIPHYFSWINNTNEGATEEQTLINLNFFKYLHDEYGMNLGIYAWDAGNLDSQSYYGSIYSDKFKKQFPDGWGPCAKLAKSFGCRLGIWGGPDGFGETEKEEQARTDMLVKMVKDYGVQLFKFDAVCGQLRDEKQKAFADAMSRCRDVAPNLIVLNHRLNLGRAKPHATTFLWGGAETYIDVYMLNRTTGTHNRVGALSRGLPPDLKRLTEDCGVCISSCLDYWEDDLVLQAFNRSLILAPEIYGNPWLLRDVEFAKLARICNLHTRNRDILVKGIVLPEESYGPSAVARGDGEKRFITLRNLTWNPVTYKVKLDEEIGLKKGEEVHVRRYHPAEAILGRFDYGDTMEVTVAPFRSFLLFATTGDIEEIGIAGSDYEVVRDTKGKEAIIKVLGMPGTSARIQVVPGARKFSGAVMEGKKAGEVLADGLEVVFPGKKLGKAYHRKLGDLKKVDVPADAPMLYEATCFAAPNTALEFQSVKRSGATSIPQVKAARDAFFNQDLFWRRGIRDDYLFDGKSETFFSAISRKNRDRRIDGGALRIDLKKDSEFDGLLLTAVWTDQEGRDLPAELKAEFSCDLKAWTPATLVRDKSVKGKVEVADITNNGGMHELFDGELIGWKANMEKAGTYRFVRIVRAPGRVAELEFTLKGKKLSPGGWTASHLFAPPEKAKPVGAWQATVTVDADSPKGSTLCVALDGDHGRNKAFAALRVDGKYVGSPHRAPSYPAVVFEAGPRKTPSNNTFYFPVTKEIRGKKVDVVVLNLPPDKNEKVDFKASVWTTCYPVPYVELELRLK